MRAINLHIQQPRDAVLVETAAGEMLGQRLLLVLFGGKDALLCNDKAQVLCWYRVLDGCLLRPLTPSLTRVRV